MSEPRWSLEAISSRYLDQVEAALLASCPPEGLLGTMGRYHLETGGKRLRALMPMWVCGNLGADPEAGLDVGVGLELLHNATLVHDDLQDGDETRRGRDTVWRRFGDAQAINAGDALYFQGVRSILAGPNGSRCAQLACDTLIRVIEGQTMEFQLQLPPEHQNVLKPSLAAWDRMARAKTAALFRCAAGSGAIVAGAAEDVIEGALFFGEEVGLLFQVQDDFLDLVGDKGRGMRGCDLAEGKYSFPVLWALEKAPAAMSERLRQIVRTPRSETSPSMVEEGLEILGESGALSGTASWLSERRSHLLAQDMANVLPGLVERVLAPVAHALPAT